MYHEGLNFNPSLKPLAQISTIPKIRLPGLSVEIIKQSFMPLFSFNSIPPKLPTRSRINYRLTDILSVPFNFFLFPPPPPPAFDPFPKFGGQRMSDESINRSGACPSSSPTHSDRLVCGSQIQENISGSNEIE